MLIFPWTFYDHDFNPRSREGSDSGNDRHVLRDCTYFNPRSREGSDSDRCSDSFPCCHFNPRSREGSDVCARHRDALLSMHFNPRSREGSDFNFI